MSLLYVAPSYSIVSIALSISIFYLILYNNILLCQLSVYNVKFHFITGGFILQGVFDSSGRSRYYRRDKPRE